MVAQQLTKYFVISSAPFDASDDPFDHPASVFVNNRFVGVAFPTLLDRNLQIRSYAHWFDRTIAPGDTVQIRGDDLGSRSLYFDGVYKASVHPTITEIATLVALPDWAVDTAEISDGVLRFSGWVLLSTNREYFDIRVNGELVKAVLPNSDRSDVAAAWRTVCGLSLPFGYTAQQEIKSDLPSMELTLSENGSTLYLNNYWYPGRMDLPIPDEPRRLRVYGYSSLSVFLRLGFTSYNRIRAVIERFVRTQPQRRIKILDWGCGCAGVGRYFIAANDCKYTGIDIDHDNIGWSKNNISAASFEIAPLLPPTRFSDAEFDVIFGVSVFTHLNEGPQMRWLAELSRITSPEGIGIFTVLGTQAIAKDPTLQANLDFLNRGFIFLNDNHEIGQIVGDNEYYGTAFHHYGYIAKRWAEHVDILAYVPGGFSQQDLIVVRRKQSSRDPTK